MQDVVDIARVTWLRKQSKITQKEMADKLAISLTAYMNRENGKTPFTVTELVCVANELREPFTNLICLYQTKKD